MGRQQIIAALALTALLVSSSSHGFGTNCHKYEAKTAAFPQPTIMPPNFKVVFFGDAGADVMQEEVLRMAVAFEPDVIVHAGDFDYQSNPSLFLSDIDAIVPESIVYLASIGNHDEEAWEGSNGYQARLIDRLERSNATQYCTGDFGINAACYYKGMYFVLSGVGTQGTGHVEYLEDAFTAVPALWKVGVWHKNQRLYQTGGKTDETGYDILDAAREFGAIIATGHEHSYSRTYVMSDFANFEITSGVSTPLEIEPGETFLFVSGLGGNSIRAWEDDLNENPWWASCAAADNGAKDGALFCTFNIDGNITHGSCYFEDTSGRVFDQFEIYNNNPAKIVKRTVTPKACHVPFFDIAVASAEGDAQENLITGRVTVDATVLPLGSRDEATPRMVALRFDNVPLVPGAHIQTANLQLFGVTNANRNNVPKLEIRGEHSVNPASFNERERSNLSKREQTSASVAWTREEDNFETGTVWVSPDIKTVLQEITSLPQWRAGNSVVLTISGLSDLEIASFDRTSCLAPSLIIELEGNC